MLQHLISKFELARERPMQMYPKLMVSVNEEYDNE
jgi:hypothetical protein